MRSPAEIVAILVGCIAAVVALLYFATRSARRESERARARAVVDGRRTDYPLIYEWEPSCRVVIHEDSFTSDLAGVRFAAPIASIWRVVRESGHKGIVYWRVLCHAESSEPQGLSMFGGGMSEVVARVLAQKAGVDVEDSE